MQLFGSKQQLACMIENETVKTIKILKTVGQLKCGMNNKKSPLQQITRNFLNKVVKCLLFATHNHE